jgi:hypothetical protein
MKYKSAKGQWVYDPAEADMEDKCPKCGSANVQWFFDPAGDNRPEMMCDDCRDSEPSQSIHIWSLAERIVLAVGPNFFVGGKNKDDIDWISKRYEELTSQGVGFGEAAVQARCELVEKILLENI